MPINFITFPGVALPILQSIDHNIQLLLANSATLQNQETILNKLNNILAWAMGQQTGQFNPPANLVKTILVEREMSVLQLEVGQTAVGKLTFDETTAPADGAVATDNPAITISLDPTDHITWTCVAVSVTALNTPANASYTGTSVLPDVGPAIVPAMAVTVVPVPVAEHGDFDPTHAVITGP